MTDPLLLENGDRMRSGEFLRRDEAMPEVKQAELVKGKVYRGSPVRVDFHAEPDGLIHHWLATHALSERGTRFHPNTTLRLDAVNTVQPDAVLCLAPERGGRTRINAKDYLTGAPKLVAEIAASAASSKSSPQPGSSGTTAKPLSGA
jgi:hypothetical protein